MLFVIPAGYSIYKALPIGEFGRWTVKHLGGIRGHESYLIQVGKSKRLYWPLVRYLEKVMTDDATASKSKSLPSLSTPAGFSFRFAIVEPGKSYSHAKC